MKIFVAGASGAIGRPLILRLTQLGHDVTAMCRTPASEGAVQSTGAKTVIVDALDAEAVISALQSVRPEVVVDELTSLPKDPRDFANAFPTDRRLRLEGGANLLRAAQRAGARRYVQQSSGFFLQPDNQSELADETSPLLKIASPGIAASAAMYSQIEARLKETKAIETVVLRYGFFYGPGTWYHADGAVANQVKQRLMPIIGGGTGIWSFVHVEDAANATVAALTGSPGVYNVVDDFPSPLKRWLPAFARVIGAPPPAEKTVAEALNEFGEDAVYYATRLSGASNLRAKASLQFAPRPLEWL